VDYQGRAMTATTGRRLVDEVVDEITAWNPREFIAAFGRMHQGRISLVHLNVLMLLEATGPIPMNRLADALDISVASVTGVVDRMESRGLVKRQRHADDRRIVLVATAAGGRKVFGLIDRRRRLGLGKLLTRLSDDELQGLLEGHRALRAARAELFAKANVAEVADVVRRGSAARAEKIDALRTRAKRGKVDRL
jgi:DNA-binding MarR family transcriptional regulator